MHDRQNLALDSLLDRDTSNVPDEVFKAILADDAIDAQPGLIYASESQNGSPTSSATARSSSLKPGTRRTRRPHCTAWLAP